MEESNILRGQDEISSGKVKHKTKLKLTFVAVLFPPKIRLAKRFTYDNLMYLPSPIPAQLLCAVMSHIGHWPQGFFSVFLEKCPSKTRQRLHRLKASFGILKGSPYCLHGHLKFRNVMQL